MSTEEHRMRYRLKGETSVTELDSDRLEVELAAIEAHEAALSREPLCLECAGAGRSHPAAAGPASS